MKFDLQWKIASCLSYLLLQFGSNDREASLPEKGATEAKSCQIQVAPMAQLTYLWWCSKGELGWMVQKGAHSETSLQNSLGPRRDCLEVRGEVLRPRNVLSWLLARWSGREWGNKRVAHCRPVDLRTRRQRKLLFLWKSGYFGPAAEQK